ncbi:MAG: sugar phosphate nucleotidyltransferase [Vicinamibacteria bacterium]
MPWADGSGLTFPIANRPLVSFALDAVRALGIREVVLVTCRATTPGVRAVVADGARWDLRVSYLEQAEPFGSARALLAAEELLGGRPFVLHRADGFLAGDLGAHVTLRGDAGVDALLLVHRVDDPSEHAVVELERGRVTGVVEHPLEPRSDLALAGVAVLGPAIFDAIRATTPSWTGRLELADALTVLVRTGGEARVRSVPGWWSLSRRRAELLAANRLVLQRLTSSAPARRDEIAETQGIVDIHPSARLEGALVRGPAVVGPGVRLTDAYVGPFTSLGAGVVVEGAEVEDSIVLPGAVIRHLRGRLESSIVGASARVVREFALPKAMHVCVADRDDVTLV